MKSLKILLLRNILIDIANIVRIGYFLKTLLFNHLHHTGKKIHMVYNNEEHETLYSNFKIHGPKVQAFKVGPKWVYSENTMNIFINLFHFYVL